MSRQQLKGGDPVSHPVNRMGTFTDVSPLDYLVNQLAKGPHSFL
jgi:hypothetical protein